MNYEKPDVGCGKFDLAAARIGKRAREVTGSSVINRGNLSSRQISVPIRGIE